MKMLQVLYQQKQMLFSAPNKQCERRVNTLFTKEPETISWLNRLTSQDIFWDVGANIGIFTVFAAKVRNARVMAFEPESLNFAELIQNITLNELNEVEAFPISILGESLGLSTLYLSKVIAGYAHHSCHENINYNLQPVGRIYKQGTVVYSLDDICYKQQKPCPTFIKIDIDGLDHKVVQGAEKILQSGSLKSLLVELNTNLPEHVKMIDFIQSFGFVLDKEATEKHLKQLESGSFKGIGNHIFYAKMPK